MQFWCVVFILLVEGKSSFLNLVSALEVLLLADVIKEKCFGILGDSHWDVVVLDWSLPVTQGEPAPHRCSPGRDLRRVQWRRGQRCSQVLGAEPYRGEFRRKNGGLLDI